MRHLHNRTFKSKGKMRYSTKEYTNPFFTRKKKKRIKAVTSEFSLRVKLTILGCLTILVLSSWLFFYSSIFTIREIRANGEGRLSSEAISKIAWQQINNNFLIVFPQKNIYFFSKNKLKQSLNEKYSFNELTIEKKLPDILIIKFKEKEYALIWHEGDRHDYADANGYIIEEANLLEISLKDYPLIDNLSENMILDNKISVPQDYLNFIIELWRKFKDYEDDFKIERYVIDSEINTVKAVIENGATIHFNTAADQEKQFNKLIIIKNEKLKDDFTSKTYIDLRYGDRVYYR